MKQQKVKLVPLQPEHRNQFILDNQEAFKFGAIEEFGLRDESFDKDGEIISRQTIEQCLDNTQNHAFRIIFDGRVVGGVVVKIDEVTNHNHLELLFTLPKEHGKGIGYGAWLAIEEMYPQTEIWETCTPYFEKRNIHFYINKCGFSAVEFWCEYNLPKDLSKDKTKDGPDEMFKFIKAMKK